MAKTVRPKKRPAPANEIELKLRVASLAPTRRALRQAGATFLHTVVQTDHYVDTDDGKLRTGDVGVRVRLTRVIRSTSPVDNRPLLTWKGPARPDATFKSRPEVQTRLDDPAVIDHVLSAAGLTPTVTVEKRRESWRLGPCTVELDTLPHVGTFVEIEGPDETAIEKIRRQLHIQGEPTRDHYVTLTLNAQNTKNRSVKASPVCVVEDSDPTKRPHVELVTAIPALPKRKTDSHKGDFGHVLVVAGSTGLAGACSLCANGALRGGAGLVTFATPANVQPTVAALAPCAMSIPLAVDEHNTLTPASVRQIMWARATVLAVGPGLGVGAPQQRLVQACMEQSAKPLVLDADGLNNLAALADWPTRRRCPIILTPHPGEFARLTRTTLPRRSEAKTETHDTQSNRIEHAIAAVKEWQTSGRPNASERERHDPPLVLVLKGAATVVTDGRRLYVNRTGNPGLATGGSGDVLTGLTAALLAQGMTPFDAAVLATHTHGLAADLAVNDVGDVALLATDVLDYIGKALRSEKKSNL